MVKTFGNCWLTMNDLMPPYGRFDTWRATFYRELAKIAPGGILASALVCLAAGVMAPIGAGKLTADAVQRGDFDSSCW